MEIRLFYTTHSIRSSIILYQMVDWRTVTLHVFLCFVEINIKKREKLLNQWRSDEIVVERVFDIRGFFQYVDDITRVVKRNKDVV